MSGPLFWKPTQGRGSSARVGSTPPPPGPPVSGYSLWLSDTGNDPGVWPDLSGNSNDSVQPTVASQLAITNGGPGGLQIRTSDGVDDFMLGTSVISGFTVSTIFFVINANDLSGGGIAFVFSSSVASDGLLSYTGKPSGTSDRLLYANGDNNNGSAKPISLGWEIWSLVSDGTNVSLYVNGVFDSQMVSSVVQPSGPYSIGRFTSGDTLFGPSSFAEVIMYSTNIGTGNRQSVQAYLGTKWGIPLGQPQITNVNPNGLSGTNFITGGPGLGFAIYGNLGSGLQPYGVWFNTGTESQPDFSSFGVSAYFSISIQVTDTPTQICGELASGLTNPAWSCSNDFGPVVNISTTPPYGPTTNAFDINSGFIITTTQTGAPNS